jgi:CheY-like chemotaxis protein
MNILIVEDHVDTAHALARILREWGHDSAVAAGAEEALRHCAEQSLDRPFDLVLCDILLGEANGWDLIRELRQKCGGKFIAVSGLGQPDDLRRSRTAGFDAHLVKPVDIERLRETIERVTGDDQPRHSDPNLQRPRP